MKNFAYGTGLSKEELKQEIERLEQKWGNLIAQISKMHFPPDNSFPDPKYPWRFGLECLFCAFWGTKELPKLKNPEEAAANIVGEYLTFPDGPIQANLLDDK